MACGRSPSLPVVLYHASIPGFGGGFVGVDIFFVISGYLICGMIDQDIRDGSFSLGDFYKRRILRILPALFAMFGVTGVLAYAYCLPVEFEDFSKSFASAVASVSNVYFAKTAGYFDAPAETKPLLHTWSLGVEEQFYFVAPLLMLLLYRFVPKHAKWLLALAAVLSFVAAILMTFRNTTFAFYLTPFRAWELALGALLAIKFIPSPATAWGKNITGGIGLALLLGVIVLGIAVGAAAADDRSCRFGCDDGDRFQRTFTLVGGAAVVGATARLRRPDLLFPLSLALAADGVPAHGWVPDCRIVCHRKAGGDCGIGRRRDPFVEVHRAAVPGHGAGILKIRRFRRHFCRDGFRVCGLRHDPAVRRRAVPLPGSDRRDQLLSRLQFFRPVPHRKMLSRH